MSRPPAQTDPPDQPPGALPAPGHQECVRRKRHVYFLVDQLNCWVRGHPGWGRTKIDRNAGHQCQADSSCLMGSHPSGAPAWGWTEGGSGRGGPLGGHSYRAKPGPPSPQVCERGLRLPPLTQRGRIPPKGQLCSGRRPCPVLCCLPAAGHSVLLAACQCPPPQAPHSCSRQTPPPGPAPCPNWDLGTEKASVIESAAAPFAPGGWRTGSGWAGAPIPPLPS